jgi:hypothetical protein
MRIESRYAERYHTINHIREDEQRVNDPQAKALFETTAEVLSGLVKAYNDYEQRKPAWK